MKRFIRILGLFIFLFLFHFNRVSYWHHLIQWFPVIPLIREFLLMVVGQSSLPAPLFLFSFLEVMRHPRFSYLRGFLLHPFIIRLICGLYYIFFIHSDPYNVFLNATLFLLGLFVAFDQSVHFWFDVEHFGVLVCFEIVAVVELSGWDLFVIWDEYFGKGIGCQRLSLDPRHRRNVFRNPKRLRKIIECLAIESLHGLMFLDCIRWDLLLSINSASFINFLEPTLQIFMLKEIVLVTLSRHHTFIPNSEYPFIIISVCSFKIEYLSSFFTLVLLVLH